MQAYSVPGQMIGSSGSILPNQLLCFLRQIICTDSCAKPDGLHDGVSCSTSSKAPGDCEVSVAIVGKEEAVSEILRSTLELGY